MDSLSSFAQLHLYALNSGCPQLLEIVNELSKELNSAQRIDLPAFVFKSMTNSKPASGIAKTRFFASNAAIVLDRDHKSCSDSP